MDLKSGRRNYPSLSLTMGAMVCLVNRATPEQAAILVLRMVESSPKEVERILQDVRNRCRMNETV